MKSFPKKYKPQDLRERSKLYIQNLSQTNNNTDYTYSTSILPISEKISYNDFFLFYLRDFVSCKKNLENSWNNKDSIHEQLFITSNNQFKNLWSNFEFFNKKNQNLFQVWVNKLERRTASINKKKLNMNNKIIESYLSSPHKLFIYDSDLYLYIINKFHSLWDKWKITKQTKICYRSFDLQTSIPEQHITWKEEKIKYHVLKYFIWAKCEALPVCVDDIDSCCWDVWLLVHPKDKRYNKYIWKNAIIPLCNRQIPIIWDENINIMQNNWIKRICPFASQEGIQLAEKYWLPTDIYVFDQKWLYTEYIHEPAFIWQERSKYYDNIEWFIQDIWNLSEKWEKIEKIPYLSYTNERLIPYKMDEIVIDLKEEKEEIINKIINDQSIHFSFIDQEYWNTFSEIKELETKLEEIRNGSSVEEDTDEDTQQENVGNLDKISKLEETITELKKSIIDEIDSFLPDYYKCSCQIPYSWKIPLIKTPDWLSFFDIEKDYNSKRDLKPLQTCFDFVLLSLVRIWAIGLKTFGANKENKLCECDKIFSIFSQNEKKIQYFVDQLRNITWDKKDYEKFINIIQNLTDEVNSTIGDCKKLIENSKFLHQVGNRFILDVEWIYDDSFNPDFVQLCIPCYLHDKNIKTEDEVLIESKDRPRIFQELLIQQLILWEPISHNYYEHIYNYDNEFLWDKQLSKTQIEQSQRDLFSLYWENPIRLSFLVNGAYDQKQVLLNSIFLKQIWNAIRLCVQKKFLPDDIAKTLNNQPEDFDDFDLLVISKLNELFDYRKEIKEFDQYIRFFNHCKASIQNIFFSWYLEIQKTSPTKNIHFVCAYFFNFLLTALYPLVPEYVNALCYISGKDFKQPIRPVITNRTIDHNMNVFYDAFIRIKNIKLELNIKQHENCNLFIKSSPSLWEIFEKYEQIFKSYLHITEINYLRLHESNLLWYEVFSDDIVTIWIQAESAWSPNEEESIENIERDIKNLEDKLNLIRQRIQLLPEWEQRSKAEEEYSETKEKMENLTIKHRLLSSK